MAKDAEFASSKYNSTYRYPASDFERKGNFGDGFIYLQADDVYSAIKLMLASSPNMELKWLQKRNKKGEWIFARNQGKRK